MYSLSRTAKPAKCALVACGMSSVRQFIGAHVFHKVVIFITLHRNVRYKLVWVEAEPYALHISGIFRVHV